MLRKYFVRVLIAFPILAVVTVFQIVGEGSVSFEEGITNIQDQIGLFAAILIGGSLITGAALLLADFLFGLTRAHR